MSIEMQLVEQLGWQRSSGRNQQVFKEERKAAAREDCGCSLVLKADFVAAPPNFAAYIKSPGRQVDRVRNTLSGPPTEVFRCEALAQQPAQDSCRGIGGREGEG